MSFLAPPVQKPVSFEKDLEQVLKGLVKDIAKSKPTPLTDLCIESNPAQRANQFSEGVTYALHRIENILDGDIELILPWIPPKADSIITKHCKKVQIPTLNGLPCLILHDLGGRLDPGRRSKSKSDDSKFEEWEHRDARIKSIFQRPQIGQHTVLLNTSGAGKTRLVLEGLCENWGFYFTCYKRPDEIGSLDLYNIIQKSGRLESLGLMAMLPLDPADSKRALEKNVAIAAQCFQAVLCVRCLVFAFFLHAASMRKDHLTHLELRKIWLLVQADPRLLKPQNGLDLFMELTMILSTSNDTVSTQAAIRSLIVLCRSAIRNLDPSGLSQIYCVIDEAQTAAQAHCDAFRDKTSTHSRSALREMLVNWVEWELPIIVTGTSLNRDSIIEALSSAVGKRPLISDGVTGTGSFVDSPEKVRKYFKKYFPRSHRATASGEELVSRACYWLYGRPRFIASYVQCVIQYGFRSYHRVLSTCIYSITGEFMPMDALNWEAAEPPIPDLDKKPLCPFDLSRARNLSPDLIEIVKDMTYERLMTGRPENAAVRYLQDSIDLVECGFARFPGATREDGDPVMDEPLAYIAAENWINKKGKERHARFFRKIGDHTPTGNGMEQYAAVCIAHVFQKFTPLSDIFSFAPGGDPRDLSKLQGRLVSCWHDTSGEFRMARCISPFAPRGLPNATGSASHHLGCLSKDLDEHIAWLKGEHKTPFLFPHENFGPDLLFRLELKTGKIITVALQVKFRVTRESFSKSDDIEHAFRSVTPKYFWKDKNGVSHDPDVVKNTIRALKQLPFRFEPQVPHYRSVLRAVFVYPAEDNERACMRLLDVAMNLESDPHEVSVIPTGGLTQSSGLIEEATERREHDAWRKRKQKKQKKHDYPFTERQVVRMKKSDIVPQLVLEKGKVKRLKTDELGYQLLLHRRLEIIASIRSGRSSYRTKHPDHLMKKRLKEIILNKAIDRYLQDSRLFL